MEDQLTDNRLSFQVLMFSSHQQFGKMTAFASVLKRMLTYLIAMWNTNVQRCKVFRYLCYWLYTFSCQYTENTLVGPIHVSIDWKLECMECSHLFEDVKRIASLPMLSQCGGQFSVKSDVHSRTSVILILSMNTPTCQGLACCATLESYSDLQ